MANIKFYKNGQEVFPTKATTSISATTATSALKATSATSAASASTASYAISAGSGGITGSTIENPFWVGTLDNLTDTVINSGKICIATLK